MKNNRIRLFVAAMLCVTLCAFSLVGCGLGTETTGSSTEATPTESAKTYQRLQDKVNYSIYPDDPTWKTGEEPAYLEKLHVPEEELQSLSDEELFAAFVDYPLLAYLSISTSSQYPWEKIRENMFLYCDAIRVLYTRETGKEALVKGYETLTAKLKTKAVSGKNADSSNEPWAVTLLEAALSDQAFYDSFSAGQQERLISASKTYHEGKTGISPKAYEQGHTPAPLP